MDIDISNIKIKREKNKEEDKEEEEDEEEEDKEDFTQIRVYEDVISLLEVSDRINSSTFSSYTSSSFDIVKRYHFIVAREKNGIKVIETSKTKQKTIILYFAPRRDHLDFNVFLFQHLTTPTLLVLHVITSYKLILDSLFTLKQMNISFKMFSSSNLIFEKKTLKPIITDLEDAFNYDGDNDYCTVAEEAVNELYGNIIQSIIIAFSLENTILNDLLERKDLFEREELMRKVDKLDKWEFVKEMNPSKMKSLHKELLSY
jgi:hypothetical protein